MIVVILYTTICIIITQIFTLIGYERLNNFKIHVGSEHKIIKLF